MKTLALVAALLSSAALADPKIVGGVTVFDHVDGGTLPTPTRLNTGGIVFDTLAQHFVGTDGGVWSYLALMTDLPADVTLASYGSVPNNNGASLAGQVLTLQPADSTHPGGVSLTTQSFAGTKSFLGTVTVNKLGITNVIGNTPGAWLAASTFFSTSGDNVTGSFFFGDSTQITFGAQGSSELRIDISATFPTNGPNDLGKQGTNEWRDYWGSRMVSVPLVDAGTVNASLAVNTAFLDAGVANVAGSLTCGGDAVVTGTVAAGFLYATTGVESASGLWYSQQWGGTICGGGPVTHQDYDFGAPNMCSGDVIWRVHNSASTPAHTFLDWTYGSPLTINDTVAMNSATVIPGNAATTAAVGGLLVGDTSTVGNVSTGEDTLHTYTLPADTLAVTNRGLRWHASGSIANNANAKTLKVYFGAVVGNFSLPISINGQWSLDLILLRSGSSTQTYFLKFNVLNTATFLSAFDREGTVTATETDTAPITMKITGEATSNDDVQQLLTTIEYL